MQGDIFQMEQMAVPVQAPLFESNTVTADSNANPQVAIYNEDDLSHLLYVNHLHHDGHAAKVVINHVYRDGYSAPLEESLPIGTRTPVSETNETPILSDCDCDCDSDSDSDSDEGAYLRSLSSAYSRRGPLKFEDGFEFPVFLGRQAEEAPAKTAARPSTTRSGVQNQRENTQTTAPKDIQVSEISGPLMSWWPEPSELMEHEWVGEKVVESKQTNVMPVVNIEGPLMSWWPTPLEYLDHEWEERFYE